MKYLLLFLVFTTFFACGSSSNPVPSSAQSAPRYQEIEALVNKQPPNTDVPDQYPRYPGGLNGLMVDVARGMRYPDDAEGEEGLVIVSYTVDANGNITNVEVTEGVNEAIDREAIRVVQGLRKWQPAMKDGRPMATQMRQPLEFNRN